MGIERARARMCMVERVREVRACEWGTACEARESREGVRVGCSRVVIRSAKLRAVAARLLMDGWEGLGRRAGRAAVGEQCVERVREDHPAARLIFKCARICIYIYIERERDLCIMARR